MTKKNTLIFMIINILTLFTFVVSATYAYFAGFSPNNSVDLETNTLTTGYLVALTDESLGLNIKYADMAMESSNDEMTSENLTASSEIQAMLYSPGENITSTCKFNVVFDWESEDFYEKTPEIPEIGKEFTIEGILTNKEELNGLGNEYIISTPELKEINIDKLEWQNLDESLETEKILKRAILLKDVTLTNFTNQKSINANYKFIIRFYNTKYDQNIQIGKNYVGYIRVDTKSISC